MKKKTQAVFNGYLSLSPRQKNKLIKKITKEEDRVQKGFGESNTISFAPLRGACPCCGK
jgi:hypothetical protein